jgi:hypothetical protein
MRASKYLLPGIIAALSCVVIWASLQLDTSPPMIVGKAMQPRAYPIFLMVLNLLLVAALTLQLRKAPDDPPPPESYHTWGTMLLLVLFYPLTVWLDMFIGIAVVMFLMCLLWGERRWLVAGTTALLTPASIFLLFDKVLQVRFPRGILTNWYYG